MLTVELLSTETGEVLDVLELDDETEELLNAMAKDQNKTVEEVLREALTYAVEEAEKDEEPDLEE